MVHAALLDSVFKDRKDAREKQTVKDKERVSRLQDRKEKLSGRLQQSYSKRDKQAATSQRRSSKGHAHPVPLVDNHSTQAAVQLQQPVAPAALGPAADQQPVNSKDESVDIA